MILCPNLHSYVTRTFRFSCATWKMTTSGSNWAAATRTQHNVSSFNAKNTSTSKTSNSRQPTGRLWGAAGGRFGWVTSVWHSFASWKKKPKTLCSSSVVWDVLWFIYLLYEVIQPPNFPQGRHSLSPSWEHEVVMWHIMTHGVCGPHS